MSKVTLGGLIITLILNLFIIIPAIGQTSITSPALPQVLGLPICEGVVHLTPENPAFLNSDSTTSFTWAGEPAGVANRVVYVFDANGSGKFTTITGSANQASGSLSNLRDLPSTYNWFVVMFDGAGQPLCHSQGGWLDVRPDGGNNAFSDDSGSGDSGDGQAVVVVVGSCFYIVRLVDSPYKGPADYEEASDNFAGLAISLSDNYCGMEIHGNDRANWIIGSALDDIIYGYGGDDFLLGDSLNAANNTGNDTIYGGDGNDAIFGDSMDGAYNAGNDLIYGGDGNDVIFGDNMGVAGDMTENVGNDSIYGEGGNDFIFGDSGAGRINVGNNLLDGGDGDDMIYGNSDAGLINYGNDTINGGAGNDTLYGDSANSSVPYENMGNDVINGGDGDDVINGDGTGVWTADDPVYNAGADTIDGGNGFDTCDGRDGANVITNCEAP